MASVIWLKIHVDILVCLANGTKQRSQSWMHHWLTTLLYFLVHSETENAVFSIYCITSCAKKCFEILLFWSTECKTGCPFGVIWEWFPFGGQFSCLLIFSEWGRRYTARRRGRWNGVHDRKKEWGNYLNCLIAV